MTIRSYNMSKICSKCGAVASDTAKFCRQCGSKLEATEAVKEKTFCPECGAKCNVDDPFCESCGFSLKEPTVDVTSAETAPDIDKVLDEWDQVALLSDWGDEPVQKAEEIHPEPKALKKPKSTPKKKASAAKKAETEIANDDWGSIQNVVTDDWGGTVKNFQQFEEIDRFADFEYKKNSRGEIIITRLLDEYALEINVPEGVVAIGDSAFEGSAAITITLPKGLTTVGKRAFANCSNLHDLVLPSTVRVVGEEAFDGDSKLEIKLPTTIKVVGDNALRGTLNEKNSKQAEVDARKRRHKQAVNLYNAGKYADALPILLEFEADGDIDDF
jgi:ribosomal protein L40E